MMAPLRDTEMALKDSRYREVLTQMARENMERRSRSRSRNRTPSVESEDYFAAILACHICSHFGSIDTEAAD